MPTLTADLGKIATNVREIRQLADAGGVTLAGVTKGICAEPQIAELFLQNGIETLADSRIQNLHRIRHLPGRRMMLRLPAINEAADTVELADVSLVSHIDTAIALSSAAKMARSRHEVILMVEMGDLREGIADEDEFEQTLLEIDRLSGLHLLGLGANFCCMYGVRPTPEKLIALEELSMRAESILNRKLELISAGNSSHLGLLSGDVQLGRATQLRIGEAFLTGVETAHGNPLPGTHPDCFHLTAEVIELNSKPTLPCGDIGLNSFGERPSFTDRGIRKRAICNIGQLDVDLRQLIPQDKKTSIIGGSSDHLILDIEDSPSDYRIGSQVSFSMTYAGILGLMSSPYIEKRMSK